MDQIKHEKALQGLPTWAQRLLAFLFQGKPAYPMLAPALFAHLRRRGVHVWFLGVNAEADLELAVKSGATAVLTDRIHWLKETMSKREWQLAKIQ